MRPALKALAEQQKQIAYLNARVARQEQGIAHLARGLQAMATMAGVQDRVAAAMLKRADTQNPAQPVPEPPAVPATQSTEEVKTPEAFADVTAPGLVPGSTNDVAADAVSTVYTPGQDIPGPAFKNLIDVTAPVDGTQNPRPLSEVKTLTDVRVGDPMVPDVAFPLRGDFANAQRTSAKDSDRSLRTMAAIRLARLEIAAGLCEGDDLARAADIEKDAARSTSDIERNIATLESVQKAAAKRANNPRLVPKSASGVQRTVPSMQGAAGVGRTASLADEDDDILFD